MVATLPLAGIRRRLACMLYESLLLLGILAVMVIPLMLFSTATKIGVPISILRVYVFLCFALYFIWHWHCNRQTLAMRTWKLRITTPDGDAPSLWQLAFRYVLAWPSIAIFGVGIAWAVFDRDRQFLHDRLAGTRIICVPPTTAATRPPAKT